MVVVESISSIRLDNDQHFADVVARVAEARGQKEEAS